jgi:hypothetical protein
MDDFIHCMCMGRRYGITMIDHGRKRRVEVGPDHRRYLDAVCDKDGRDLCSTTTRYFQYTSPYSPTPSYPLIRGIESASEIPPISLYPMRSNQVNKPNIRDPGRPYSA